MIRIALFDAKAYDRLSFDPLLRDDLSVTYFETKLDAGTARLAAGYDVVCVFVNDTLDAATLGTLASEGVRLIALRCAGFNNVDVQAAYGKIHVIRVPSYSPEAIAEHTMALLLTSVRRIHKAYNRTREFNFSIAGLVGFNLCGKTVGVIGAGRIGQAFIRICNGFGMKVLAYDMHPNPSVNAEFVDLDTLYRQSDIISLHCPLTADNYHLIGAEALAKMKNGVILLNTSRGALLDAEALIDAIKRKKVSAACLDVYEEESNLFFDDKSGHILQDDVLSRLLSMPNVILTSHQAFLTEEALHSIAETTVSGIRGFFAGELPQNEVCYRCGKQETCAKTRAERCF